MLYVNPPIDRRTRLNETTQDKFTQNHIKEIRYGLEPLKKVDHNLWALNPPTMIESINWIPSTILFSFLNFYNNKRLAGDVKEAISAIGFQSFIIINDKDMFRSFYLKELLRPKLYIYLDRDYTLGFDYWKRHGTSLEPKLMAKSDGVVCNSLDFKKRAARFNPNSYYIGNGGGIQEDIALTSLVKPDILKQLKGTIIGYVGVLTAHRLDISLIERLATHFRDASLVLIGPEDDEFKRSNLHNLENVIFIPKKDKNEIPAYVYYFDVCINPQVVNEITLGNFPLKIVEYLAMGKPVVATTTNTMEEVFSRHTYLASTPDEFIRKIQVALNEDTPQRADERKIFSRQFSWRNVTDELLKAIHDIERNGKK
ncbi:glycosyltransferase [Pedobacter faecalis]|uniref:glycosyltransferase n=1 Tax=Pedobacter faecalis TaxID=3041495 RepID=UPI002550509B|nr:glycosyltransferase [Pedobacter sp. ELA7]